MEIYSDGGARGNPGPGACAFVVIEGGKVIHKGQQHLGKTTNNQAEYHGVLLGLKWLLKQSENGNAGDTKFFVDSELIARQINGIYKVKDPILKKLISEVNQILRSLKINIKFINVPRTNNKLADYLVNKTLDETP